VNGAARNTQRVAGSNVYWDAVDGEGDHTIQPINGLLVGIVRVSWGEEALACRNHELEDSNTAARVCSRDQETNSGWACLDRLV
jgi:hypothetical protein